VLQDVGCLAVQCGAPAGYLVAIAAGGVKLSRVWKVKAGGRDVVGEGDALL
jgi:hypothetical protein